MANRVVWSSGDGDLRKARDPTTQPRRTDGGRVKVKRETAGRRGKAVTTVSNLPLSDQEISALAGKLKKRCGVGGSAKDGVIELQGDHREAVMAVLGAEGFELLLSVVVVPLPLRHRGDLVLHLLDARELGCKVHSMVYAFMKP